MTLTEYKNQKEAKRGNIVTLQKGEYLTGATIPIKGDQFTQIWVNGFPYEYLLKNGSGRLYTTDKDGNPKRLSVFLIETLEQ